MWLKILIICLTLNFAKGKLISVESNSSSAVYSYIHQLLLDFDTKTHSTHDVAVFRQKKVNSSNADVDDLFEGICKSIPESMPFHLSPMHTAVEFRNLRPSSFTVIVSDESNAVSNTL